MNFNIWAMMDLELTPMFTILPFGNWNCLFHKDYLFPHIISLNLHFDFFERSFPFLFSKVWGRREKTGARFDKNGRPFSAKRAPIFIVKSKKCFYACGVSPIFLASSMRKWRAASGSLGMMPSRMASLRAFFRVPTSRLGFRLNICMISSPSMTGWKRRL